MARQMIRVTATLALLSLLGSAVADSRCFYLDGSATDSSFTPCDPSAAVSACCANNKGSISDICTSEGLCYAQDGGYRGFIYSNGCTDKTGKDAACPHFCPDVTDNWGGGSAVNNYNVLQCTPGTYCCRATNDATSCCNNSTRTFTGDIGSLLIDSTTTSTATVTATSSTGTATVGSSTGTSTPTSCPQNNTAVIGGAVGGILGVALLATLAALGCVLRKRRHEKQSDAAAAYVTSNNHHQSTTPMTQYSEPARSSPSYRQQSPNAVGGGRGGQHYEPVKYGGSSPSDTHDGRTPELGGVPSQHEMQG